jgi:hypothetical protein
MSILQEYKIDPYLFRVSGWRNYVGQYDGDAFMYLQIACSGADTFLNSGLVNMMFLNNAGSGGSG